MPRQAAKEGVECVDRLDPSREAKEIDRFFDAASAAFKKRPVFVHQDDNAGIVAAGNQRASNVRQGVFCVCRHFTGVFVLMPVTGVKNLVEEAADLLFPLLAVFIHHRLGLVLIHENKSRGPTVLHRQLAQACQHPWMRLHWQALNRHNLNELPAKFWNDSSPQFLSSQNAIKVHRVLRQRDRMRNARDAELEPPQEFVLHRYASVFILNFDALQASQ